jgi:3',5'-nucleoside bisphosphate phosphatase
MHHQGSIMLLEIHNHTSEHSPCSIAKAVTLLRQVYAKGLQGVVITDHHYLWQVAELHSVKHHAEVSDSFLVLAGQEVTTSDAGDILVYGAEASVSRGVSLSDLRARYPEAALVWAHPYRYNRMPGPDDLLNPLLDGIEILSGNQSALENSRGIEDWRTYKFTAVSGTDTHAAKDAGAYPTLFDQPVRDIYQLAEEIRKGRCRPFPGAVP